MKRRWVASLSVLLAVSGRGLTQEPGRLPDVTPNLSPPGKAVVISQDKTAKPSAENPKEGPTTPPQGKAQVSSPAVPANSQGNNCNQNQSNAQCEKPPLIDCHTGPPEQTWARFSYLYWRTTNLPIPQVLASVNDVPAFGAESIDYGYTNGGKIEAGMWLDCRHTSGFQVGGFLLQEQTENRVLDGSTGVPRITRPVLDGLPNLPTNVIVAGAADSLTGVFAASVSTRLGSVEGNFVRNMFFNGCWSFDGLLGVRYISLEDELRILTDSQIIGAGSFVVAQSRDLNPNFATDLNRLTVTDRFRTRNQFYAGQVGARAEYRSGIWFGSMIGKLAIGSNHQTAEIAGETVGSNGARQVTAAGGLLAVPGGELVAVTSNGQEIRQGYANAGDHKTDWLSIAPEFGVTVGAQVTCNVRVFVGYNFLYINNVVRPGDLVDTTANRKYVPFSPAFLSNSGPDTPRFRTSRDDFIAHGFEAGLGFSF